MRLKFRDLKGIEPTRPLGGVGGGTPKFAWKFHTTRDSNIFQLAFVICRYPSIKYQYQHSEAPQWQHCAQNNDLHKTLSLAPFHQTFHYDGILGDSKKWLHIRIPYKLNPLRILFFETSTYPRFNGINSCFIQGCDPSDIQHRERDRCDRSDQPRGHLEATGSHWKPLEYLGITVNHLTSAMQSTSTISEKSHPTPQRPAGLPAHSRRMLLLWYLWLARLTPEAQESDLQIPPMCSLALRLPVQSAGMNVTYDLMIMIYIYIHIYTYIVYYIMTSICNDCTTGAPSLHPPRTLDLAPHGSTTSPKLSDSQSGQLKNPLGTRLERYQETPATTKLRPIVMCTLKTSITRRIECQAVITWRHSQEYIGIPWEYHECKHLIT